MNLQGPADLSGPQQREAALTARPARLSNPNRVSDDGQSFGGGHGTDSASRYVSHGLHMKVVNGQIVYRKTSRIVP